MLQIVPKAAYGVRWATDSIWGSLLGGNGDVGSSDTFGASWARIPLPIAVTARKLTLYSGDARAFDLQGTICKNGLATALTAQLAVGDDQVDNSADEASFAAGDDIAVRWAGGPNPGGAGAPGYYAALAVVLEGAENVYGISPAAGSITAGHAWFGGAFGNGVFQNAATVPANGGPLSHTYSIAAISGTVTKLCLKEIGSTAVGGGWTAYLRVDGILQDGSGGTVDTAVTLADGGGVIVGTIACPFALTQHVEIVVVRNTTNAPFSTGQIGVSIAVTPDTAGQFMFCGGNNNALSVAADGWEWTDGGQLVASEALTQAPAGQTGFAVTGLYVEASDPSNVGATLTGTYRVDGADTAATVTLAVGDTAKSITGLTVPAGPGQRLSMLIAPANTPLTIGEFHWGLAAIVTGALTIIKAAVQDPDEDFPIAIGGGADPASITLKDGQSQTIAVPAGTYSVEELVPDGWTLQSWTVSNDPGGDLANIVVDTDETVVVTLVNVRSLGTVVVEKQAPDDPDQDFTIQTSGGLTEDDSAITLRDGQSHTFTDVPAGSGYGLAELLPPGWELASVTVSNDSDPDNLTVGADEVVTVTFINQRETCECCMATKLDIIQAAAYALGISRVPQALGEASREATTLEALYDRARTETLRLHPWAFATKYADAANAVDGYMNLVGGDDETPAIARAADGAREWQYAYRYPLDCLYARRLVEDNGRGFTPFEAEKPFRVGRYPADNATASKVILANEPDAVLEYTADVECSDDFVDPLFERALIAYLAWLAAPSLIRDEEKPKELFGKYSVALELARSRDVNEQQRLPGGEPDWIRGR